MAAGESAKPANVLPPAGAWPSGCRQAWGNSDTVTCGDFDGTQSGEKRCFRRQEMGDRTDVLTKLGKAGRQHGTDHSMGHDRLWQRV